LGLFLMGYLNNLTDIGENYVVRHLKVLYVQHNYHR
jgi:hypothetical protein